MSTVVDPWICTAPGVLTNMLTGATESFTPPGGSSGQFGIDLNMDGWSYLQGTYTLNTTTSAPPATGEVRVNNTNPASVTHIYASLTGQPGADLTSLLATFTVGHVLLLQDLGQLFPPTTGANYTITAKTTVGGTYIDFTVTYVAASTLGGAWTNNIYMLCDTSQAASYGTVRQHLIRDYMPNGIGKHAKFFDGGSGWLTAYSHFTSSSLGSGHNEGEPVFCAKKHTSATLNTLITNMATNYPGKDFWVCFWQEMEDDFTKGTAMPAGGLQTGPLTIAKWQATWQDMDAVRVAAGAAGAHCKFVPCLLNYQEQDKRPLGPQWNTFLPIPTVQIDCIGWDTYDASDRAQTWNFATTYLPKILASAAACNCNFALTEFGIMLSTVSGTTDTVTLLTARINAMITACQAQSNFGWVNYYLDNNQTVHAYPSSYGAQLMLNQSTALAAFFAVMPT